MQIGIDEADRRYLRFLWQDKEGSILKFQLKVLPFGLICSPAVLTNVIKKIVDNLDNEHQMLLSDSIYMDDIIIGNDEEVKILSLVQVAKRAFEDAGFKFHKFKSSSPSLRKAYADVDESPTKVLGVIWDRKTDALSLSWPVMNSVSTKRDLLSLIGRFFDPMGWFEPVKGCFRVVFSKLADNDWEDDLAQEHQEELVKYLSLVPLINEISLPRILKFDQPVYIFCDASITLYGYVIFIGVDLLFGKTKVSPKSKTIVELELLALLESTKAIARMIESNSIEKTDLNLFTDSRINLDRLQNSPSAYDIKIARRLLVIQRICSNHKINVYHIPGNINPADYFSRPEKAKEYIQKRGWQLDTKLVSNLDSKIKVKRVCCVRSKQINSLRIIMDRVKRLQKMINIISGLQRWFERSTARRWSHTVLEKIILIYQMSSKRPDMTTEENMLIRFSSRLPQKQLWIPGNTVLANELLTSAHRRSLHRGSDMSMAFVNPEFRIVNGNRVMRSIVLRCETCARLRNRCIRQPLGPLHGVQIQFLKPFEALSVDLFGPLFLINKTKTYGLVAICRTSRALKLQVVDNLSTQALVRSFIGLFELIGFPKSIYSDNGTNFVAAQKYFEERAHQGEICNIAWNFSVPLGPWQNGSAERMVRLTKECLLMVNCKWKSTMEVARTFQSIEFVINSRPILVNDGVIVTAYELAYGRKIHLDPGPSEDNVVAMMGERKSHRGDLRRIWISQYINKLSRVDSKKAIKIQTGDFVLCPTIGKRSRWPIAEVIQVMSGSDGVVRRALLRLNGSELWRPVNGLVLLPRSGGEETVAVQG